MKTPVYYHCRHFHSNLFKVVRVHKVITQENVQVQFQIL